MKHAMQEWTIEHSEVMEVSGCYVERAMTQVRNSMAEINPRQRVLTLSADMLTALRHEGYSKVTETNQTMCVN
jgi:hypothetical protein